MDAKQKICFEEVEEDFKCPRCKCAKIMFEKLEDN